VQAALKREKLKHNMLEVLHIKDRIVDAQVSIQSQYSERPGGGRLQQLPLLASVVLRW
jgi:hypothetical protein